MLAVVGCGIAAWTLVHRVPWLGPMIADGLRAVIGVDAVAKLEDWAYAVEDRFNRFWRANEAPKAYWEVPARPAASALSETEADGCKVPAFTPRDVAPMHASFTAPGDGTWVPIADERRPDAAPLMYKTLIHPDARRSWSALSVVAVDLRQVRLHMMAGSLEPKTETKEGRGYERAAVIPKEHHAALLAAFNGGFKAEHGHYGIEVEGVTLIAPRIRACWLAMLDDDALVLGDWERLKAREPEARWWRQTPGCMIEDGKLHQGLAVSELNRDWGATLEGDTVIRRSAVAVSKDGKVLYSGIGDHVTARALALGMQHAGAHTVAQLDVNWSYPKFVVYQPRTKGASELVATKLSEGFELDEDEYLRERHPRDFFYLTKKSDEDIAALVCGEAGAGARKPGKRAAREQQREQDG